MDDNRIFLGWVPCPDCHGSGTLVPGSTARCPRCAKPEYSGRLPYGMIPAVTVLNDDGLWDAIVGALAALVDAEAHGVPGGYIGVYPDETDRYCTYCLTSWRHGEPERHAPDCPIAAARRALEGGA